MCDMKIYKKSIIIMEINLNEIYNKTDNLDKIQAVIDYFDRYIVTSYIVRASHATNSLSPRDSLLCE